MNHGQTASTVLGIVAVLVVATNSHAADIFVNGTCGDDAWSGLSDVCLAPDGPKATIHAGITAANPGDVVIVAQGEYFELGLVVTRRLRLTFRQLRYPAARGELMAAKDSAGRLIVSIGSALGQPLHVENELI